MKVKVHELFYEGKLEVETCVKMTKIKLQRKLLISGVYWIIKELISGVYWIIKELISGVY